MLTQEKPTTKQQTFSKTEKSKTPFILPKIGILIGFLLILGMGLGIYALFSEPKNDESYLLDLIHRIEGGEELPSGEMRDYCHLMAVLRDSISPPCVCILDGINWDNPPKSPDRLPEVWEEFFKPNNQGDRRFFKHKMYKNIRIDFDAKDKNGKEKPHWHRENPNEKDKKYQYLDKNCNPIKRGLPDSHIYVRIKK